MNKDSEKNGKYEKGFTDSFSVPKDLKPAFDDITQWLRNNGIAKSDFYREAILSAYGKNKHIKRKKLHLNFKDDSTSENRDAARENQGVPTAS